MSDDPRPRPGGTTITGLALPRRRPGGSGRRRAVIPPWETTSARPAWTVCMLASLALVAVLTLTPEGRGWAWGSPVVELRWYLDGLHSTATMLQLTGNLTLLAAPAALAVVRWSALGHLPRLAAASLAMGTGIELLQWALPLGRVVSPVDAVLNAAGAIASGLLVAHLRQSRRVHR